MKQYSLLLSIVALAATSSLAIAASTVPKIERVEKRIIVGHPGADKPGKPVTYLGVEAGPMPPALGAQLRLPEGQGLVVNFVVPESPAAKAGLQQHDVLLKLDDQILIDMRQLSVLVRGKAEGDAVALTYVRAGASATAKAVLTKREVPEHDVVRFRKGPGGELLDMDFDFQIPDDFADRIRERVERHVEGLHLPSMARGIAGGRMMLFPPKATIVVKDDDGSLELRYNDEQRHLVAKDTKGKVVFDGPVHTPEQRAALTPELRARLEEMETIEVIQPPAPPAAPAAPVVPAAPVAPVPSKRGGVTKYRAEIDSPSGLIDPIRRATS